MIFCYKFLTFFFYPIFILIIYFRKLFNKEHKKRYKEKLFSNFFNPRKIKSKKLLWFHAASVGEVQSIFPMIIKLKEINKEIEFLITTVTLSAGNLVQEKFYKSHYIHHRYFPVDVNFLIKKFLNDWSPDLILFVDSEIWPNLILESKRRNIPSIIINGRIRKRSFQNWMLFPQFAKKVFSKFSLCLTASKESKKYFKELNVKNIKYIGNLKLASFTKPEKTKNLDKILNKNKIWCAASTHAGEELLCLKTHIELKKIYENLLTIIVPRHISRTNEIKNLCNELNLSFQVLNNNKDLIKKKNEIILVNYFGGLSKFFSYSKSVFIGKSTLINLKENSGQNPIEAAKLGCKIYHGPYVNNFKEIYELFDSLNISKRIVDANELAKRLIVDLRGHKKNVNMINKSLNKLGKNVLNKSVGEINKLIL
tara:strand:+ start:1384 stop:2655 length:1272 start_codon:yes stop_codon:yes gene_type:complete